MALGASNVPALLIVKMHALLEAAATHALVAHTGLTSAQEFFSHLELSSVRTGKLTFADALGLVTSEERGFILSLSQIRNFYVHDVKNVKVSLVEYFSALPRDKGKQYAKTFCYVDFERPDAEVSNHDAVNRLLPEPKRAIWSAAVFVVAILQLQVDTARMRRKQKNEASSGSMGLTKSRENSAEQPNGG